MADKPYKIQNKYTGAIREITEAEWNAEGRLLIEEGWTRPVDEQGKILTVPGFVGPGHEANLRGA